VGNYLDIVITIVILSVLTIGMLWPLEPSPIHLANIDRFIHVIAFAILSFPLIYTNRLNFLTVLIIFSVFGGTIEIIQPLSGRSAEIYDWVANIAGIFSGLFLVRAYNRFKFPTTI